MDITGLIGQDWADQIGSEFKEPYFLEMGKFISERRKSVTVYPRTTEGIFSVFYNTPFDSVKVVIVGQDPYPDGSYSGMAFSNKPNTLKVSPSLKNILKEVEDDVYDGFTLNSDPDLTRWQEQGVFLINRVLTVEHKHPNSHQGIGWETFTTQVLRVLDARKNNIVFMLWGGDAHRLEPYLKNTNNLILKTGHPSPLSANRGYWFGNKHFSQANKFLGNSGQTPIIW